MSTGTAHEIRCRNRFDVLRRIYAADEPVSRQEIAAATGLSFATVATLVGELLDAGVLIEAARQYSGGGGRPRARLAVNARRGLLVGVDVAETNVHFAVFDLAMNVLAEFERPIEQGTVPPEGTSDLIAQRVRTMLSGLDRALDDVLGFGIAIPGLVEPERGVSVCSPCWSWKDVPVRSLLAERLELPIYVENPLMAGTVAEMWFGAGREAANLLVVTLRGGAGVGIAVDGALYRGGTNSAGEWGHSCLVPDGRLCRCGNLGCVEAYVGTTGVAATLREVAPGSPLPAGDDDQVVAALGRAAADGDPDAVKAVEVVARHLGTGVTTLVHLFDPEVLVFEGSVAEALGPRLLAETERVVERQVWARPGREVRLRLSAIPGNPVSRGAATLALQGFLNGINAPGAARAGR